MDYKQLEQEINKIIELVEKIPEKYQEKCFEILMRAYVASSLSSVKPIVEVTEQKPESQVTSEFIVPIDVTAFCSQYSVPEDIWQNLFVIHGNDIRPKYKIEATKKAKAQMQITLLLAFENALKTAKFEFSIETVRQRCIEYKCYDSVNFMTHFKKKKDLFKSLSDQEHVELSADGKADLAEIIMLVAK